MTFCSFNPYKYVQTATGRQIRHCFMLQYDGVDIAHSPKDFERRPRKTGALEDGEMVTVI